MKIGGIVRSRKNPAFSVFVKSTTAIMSEDNSAIDRQLQYAIIMREDIPMGHGILVVHFII